MIDLESLFVDLAKGRPIFHSEADFQHELAWQIHASDQSSEVRLERPVEVDGRRLNIDILVHIGGAVLAFELKYWTKRLEVTERGEKFLLRKQAAQDISRYDFWKDVARLERFVAAGSATRGFAIAITNDQGYWRESSRETVDQSFRLHDGRVSNSVMAWKHTASTGTMRGREEPISLDGRYVVSWQPHSRLAGAAAGEFKMVVIEVGKRG